MWPELLRGPVNQTRLPDALWWYYHLTSKDIINQAKRRKYMQQNIGPALEVSKEIHQSKYRSRGESFRDAMTRVADGLKDSPEHFEQFREILYDMRFMPAGRVQAAIGAPRRVTPYNCFVSRTIPDSMNGIMEAATEAATTMRMGGGIGYDFCVDPGTMVLKSDLTWVAASELRSGDELIGFDENPNLQTSLLRKSTVEENVRKTLPRVKVTTDKGEIIVSTMHRFVARPDGKPVKHKGDGYRWMTAAELTPGAVIAFASAPWVKSDLDERDAGWLAGVLDGEGCISSGGDEKSHMSIAQNEGVVTDAIDRMFDAYSIGVTRRVYRDPLVQWTFNGKWEAMRVLGLTRPVRLLPKAVLLWEGRKLSAKHNPPAVVLSVEALDDGDVMSVQTSTRTLITNGFYSHNSTLRPRGDRIKSLDSQSSGPISFMGIFDAVCKTISSAGHRRGAQMGVLRIDHPDVEEFILAKQNSTNLTAFNISLAVTDEFMRAVKDGASFDLRWGGKVYKTVDARSLWDTVMRSTWDWAEPGVLFIDRINQANNLWYCETIAATNPCAEQPLPPHGACLLGSFNLVKYITYQDGVPEFDWALLQWDIPAVVRAMDNVVERAVYPLPQQEMEAKQKRRMGLGVTGLANAMEALGYTYGSEDFLKKMDLILQVIAADAYMASSVLAAEKGPFPLYNEELYQEGEFIMRLPEYVRSHIKKHGIRNSHLLSIAPTGTISLSADNVSSGIEPVFSLAYDRTIIKENGPEVERVEDYGYRVFGVRGKTADECSVDDHVNALLVASKWVDSAVSKTCNVGENVGWEDFKNIYMRAWEGGAKGCTTFRAAGKRYGILNKVDAGEDDGKVEACYINPETGVKECG